MLHAGLDLSRRRVDVCLLSDDGELVAETAAPSDVDGLRGLAGRVARLREPVRAVIESMNGARFVHDTLEELGWEVLVADAQKVKGLAPLACKTDKIDARVLAVLSQRDLVPAIWLPDPSIRRERELARYRLHLVRHRTTLKNRIHATLITFGHPCPVSDLFVLVGDHRQLAEIEAGGAFRALARRLPVIELTENRRQAAAWERDALALLRDGDARLALKLYEDHGRVVAGEHADGVRRRLVGDWWAARDPDGALMIAFRRVDVADLNGRARALMRASGRLGTEELMLPGGAFAVGDRVLLRRNDRRIGVANGDRATVVAINVERGTMALDMSGRRVTVDRAYLERTSERVGPSLVHGYAITGHSAQGLTCDRAFVLITNEASREWCYTALSRGRQANRIYAVVPEDERLEYAPSRGRGRDVLADAFGRSAAQTLASERGRDLFDRGMALGR